jgi:hypothetical protein
VLLLLNWAVGRFLTEPTQKILTEWEVDSLLLNVLKVAVTIAGAFNVQS